MKVEKTSVIMRRILAALDGDIEKAAAIYGILEDAGLIRRASNVAGWPAPKYGRALAKNEVRKHSRLITTKH